MVAEILAGIALVNSAVKGIRSAIGTAQDVSAIAGDIDNLFAGASQVKKKKKPDALWYEAANPKGMKETDPRYIHTTDYIVPRSVFYGNSTEKQKRDWLKRDKKNVAGKKKK